MFALEKSGLLKKIFRNKYRNAFQNESKTRKVENTGRKLKVSEITVNET